MNSNAMAAAVAAHRSGRLTEAANLYRRILRAEPNQRESLHLLGMLELQLQRPEQAYALFRQAIAAHGPLPALLAQLATASLALNRPEETIFHAVRALIQEPGQARTLGNLAFARMDLGRLSEAVRAFQLSLAVEPGQSALYAKLSLLLMETGRTWDAWHIVRRAIVTAPQDSDFYNQAGWIAHQMVRLDDAVASFGRALTIAPQTAKFYRGLVEVTKVRPDMPQLGDMERLAKNSESLDRDSQIELQFALGKAYDDLGDRGRGFRHMQAANVLKRQSISYDEAATLGVFAQVRESVTADLIRRAAGQGDPSSCPIFILGMPRSGSSLIEQILASHPQVFGAGEQTFFSQAMKKATGADWSPDWLSKLSAVEWRSMGADYLSNLKNISPESERIIDKMPNNFRFAGVIHLALPGAKIIHSVRDPIDTSLSCFSKLFATGLSYTYDLAELGRYYRAYRALMDHWRAVLPDGVMLEVRYEDVVADLEGQARRLVEFCGLPWDEACLSFHETERRVWTASVNQVRQPIYKTSVGRWRPDSALLAPLVEGIGQ